MTMSMLNSRDASVPVIVGAGLRSPSAAAVRAGRDAWSSGLMTRRSETAAATSPLTALLAGGAG